MFRSKKKSKSPVEAPAEDSIALDAEASLLPAPTYLKEMNTSTTPNKNKNQVKLEIDLQALQHGAVTLLTGADLVGSIDQGTSSTRFLVFTAAGKIAASAQMEHRQIFPNGEDKVSTGVCVHVGVYSRQVAMFWNHTGGSHYQEFVVLIVSCLFLLSHPF
jgi:hypothetical protein